MFIVLGSSGYIGSYFISHLTQKGELFRGVSRKEIDYTDRSTLLSFLRENRPRFLINAAGYTGKPNVDACESEKDECLFGNAVLPGRIRSVCEELGISWGHISSGCIYSGRKSNGEGWSEEDEPNFSFRSGPCSFYSGTKALGEEVLKGASNCYIWRLRIPFNEERSPRNYLQKLLNYSNLLEAENSISNIDEYVESCLASLTNECEPGVYNLTNPGSITTRQVVKWIQEEGVSNQKFDFFKNEEEFMNKAAITPRSNCVMDTAKSEQNGIAMRPVEEAVRDSLRKMREQVPV